MNIIHEIYFTTAEKLYYIKKFINNQNIELNLNDDIIFNKKHLLKKLSKFINTYDNYDELHFYHCFDYIINSNDLSNLCNNKNITIYNFYLNDSPIITKLN